MKIHCNMKQNTKDWIQHLAAIALVLASIAMGFLAFVLTKDIGSGPLTYIAESLSAALALFGIGVFVNNKVSEVRQEATDAIRSIKREGGDT